MMRYLPLGLTLLVGCSGNEDAPIHLPTRPLSQLPAPRLDVVANTSMVFVGFMVDAIADGACPVLDDDFRATVNDVAIPILAGGASVESDDLGTCVGGRCSSSTTLRSPRPP